MPNYAPQNHLELRAVKTNSSSWPVDLDLLEDEIN
jgi:hypothetical protein